MRSEWNRSEGKGRLLDLMLRAKAKLFVPLDLELPKEGLGGMDMVSNLPVLGSTVMTPVSLLHIAPSPCPGKGCRK